MDTSSLYMPKYTSIDAVKQDLESKVPFSNTNDRGVSDNEILDNIEDAEALIQLELSRQYLTPFQGVNSNGALIPFNDIQPKSTIKYVSKMCLLQSCILLMQTFFGRSEGTRGVGYLEEYQEQLERQLHKIIGIDEKSGQYLYPPLEGLALNPSASYFRPGIEMPMLAKIGSTSRSYGNQVLNRLINGVNNWYFTSCANGRYRR